MSTPLPLIVACAAALALLAAICAAVLARSYRRIPAHRALVIRGRRDRVSFTPTLVLPLLEQAEEIDLSTQIIRVVRAGREGLICKDNVRMDVELEFLVSISRRAEDVLRVARMIGCQRASDPEALRGLFEAKFSEALKTIGKGFEFEEVLPRLEELRCRLIEVIGLDLNGFQLEDVAVARCELTPLKALDPDNILDAQGIKKLIELRALNLEAARAALARLEGGQG